MPSLNLRNALRRNPTASNFERDERLGVLVRYEFECNGRLHDAPLLAELNAAWGA